jgi:hypothetical protein
LSGLSEFDDSLLDRLIVEVFSVFKKVAVLSRKEFKSADAILNGFLAHSVPFIEEHRDTADKGYQQSCRDQTQNERTVNKRMK